MYYRSDFDLEDDELILKIRTTPDATTMELELAARLEDALDMLFANDAFVFSPNWDNDESSD